MRVKEHGCVQNWKHQQWMNVITEPLLRRFDSQSSCTLMWGGIWVLCIVILPGVFFILWDWVMGQQGKLLFNIKHSFSSASKDGTIIVSLHIVDILLFSCYNTHSHCSFYALALWSFMYSLVLLTVFNINIYIWLYEITSYVWSMRRTWPPQMPEICLSIWGSQQTYWLKRWYCMNCFIRKNKFFVIVQMVTSIEKNKGHGSWCPLCQLYSYILYSLCSLWKLITVST